MFNYFAVKILELLEIEENKLTNIKRIWYPLFITISFVVFSPLIAFVVYPFVKQIFTPIVATQVSRQEWLVSLFIIISNLLLFWNTLMFMADAKNVVKKFIETQDPTQSQQLDKDLTIFLLFNIGTLLASFALCFCYFFKIIGNKWFTYESLFIANEIIAPIIFGLFCLADAIILKLLKTAIVTNPNDNQLKSLKNFTNRAFVTIDIAGFAGAFIILGLCLIAYFYLHSHFIEGFSIGALLFHILFTQINYAYLKTLELKEDDIKTVSPKTA